MRRFLPILILLVIASGCDDESLAPSPADTIPPSARVLPLTDEQTSLLFTLEVEVEDDGGSGVAWVEVFAKRPDAEWESLGQVDAGAMAFQASEGGPHAFYAVAVDGAGNHQDPATATVVQTLVPEPIIITDQRGEDFDITNAVLRYGMSVSAWGHGLGRDTIRPVVDPVFIAPGEPGYPAPGSQTEIMAVANADSAHAYEIGDIQSREVVNDVFAGAHLAATY